jgi:hypothetical protein
MPAKKDVDMTCKACCLNCIDRFINKYPTFAKQSSTYFNICIAIGIICIIGAWLFNGMMVANNPNLVSFSQYSTTQLTYVCVPAATGFLCALTSIFFCVIGKRMKNQRNPA